MWPLKKNNKNNSPVILITGGHATPAIACINELLARGYDNLVYVGQKKSILFDKNFSSEYRQVKEKLGIKFYSILAGKLSLFRDFFSIIWLIRLPIGFLQAFILIVFLKPKLVLTFGSHVGVPISFWAYIFRIPIVMHEQTTTIGRANRFIQSIATKVCLAWDFELADYNISDRLKSKAIVTGNPVREEVFLVKTNKYTFDNDKPVLLITGGNQGSHYINKFIFENIYFLLSEFNIIHQTGSNTIYNDYSKALEIAKTVNVPIKRYIPIDFIFSDEIGEIYSKATLLISRAGANTITELILLRKKAILIPIITSSGNEQFKNAMIMEKLGLGKVIFQGELEINMLLKSINELMQKEVDERIINKLSLLHEQSAKKIVNTIEELLL